jgi:FKBP-type peptidyl-prolyl cis-trans isomerase FklB
MMKALSLTVLCLFALALVCFAAAEEPTLNTPKEKLSYTVGVAMGTNLKDQNMDVDLDLVNKGMKDVMTGAKLMLTEEEMKAVRIAFQTQQVAKMKEESEKNKKEGEAFLEENKKKEGVQTTASGLEYKVIKEGDGPKPKTTDIVTVNYRGTFINGKEFDSSYSRNEPATFPLNGVIKGWTEGLQLMTAGSKYMLYIPASLGYGEHGAGGVIPPNSTLIFEVELLSIKPSEAANEPQSQPQSQTEDEGDDED